MTPEQINIAIAEACGYKPHIPGALGVKRWIAYDHESGDLGDGVVYLAELPDYHSSLDAMHEVEKVLDANQRVTFGCHLARLGETYECTPGNERLFVNWGATHATAAQRAEAFLRTLGKWDAAP